MMLCTVRCKADNELQDGFAEGSDMSLNDGFKLPRFYAIPMFLALASKAAADAFFEIGAVKYLYFLS